MKCSKCGALISEGSLYCEKCGEEVQMVPLYEVETELNLKQSISAFFEETGILNGDKYSNGEITGNSVAKFHESKKKRINFTKVLLYLLIVAIIIVFVGFLTIYFLQHSSGYYVRKGTQYTASYEYTQARLAYEKALELDSENTRARVALADLYCVTGHLNEYEQHLMIALEYDELSEDELLGIYERLIELYITRQRGKDVRILLEQCDIAVVKEHFSHYLVKPPVAELSEGDYQGVQILKLQASEGVDIYYTLDGTDPVPGENGSLYHLPIVMENGSFVVTACAVNQEGVPSATVSFSYSIENGNVSEPVVYPVSGSYALPQFIELDGNVDNIYYTTDGSTPNSSSKPYQGPIPMPLGETLFKFVRIEQEASSKVVQCKYHLELSDAISNVKAVNIVLDYALGAGKIKDESGSVDETGAKLEFIYQCAMPIGEEGYFYIVYERFVDSDGSSFYNGNEYGVNIYSGQLYQLKKDMYYNYELVEIESES
ncbi:MAG: chitobiase/beta-hexosaminidase C-terminal domain-containing protein [Lachnospiraceae bacterium]|nr:chitobiase/beta-hexosaminidase C-terminal domain-containing protein [Lachnospiraceae bacterium]